jgi:hypothetical protein
MNLKHLQQINLIFLFNKLKKKYPSYNFKIYKNFIFFDFNFSFNEEYYFNLFFNLENEKKNPKTENKNIKKFENYEITKIFFNCLEVGLEKEKFKYNID